MGTNPNARTPVQPRRAISSRIGAAARPLARAYASDDACTVGLLLAFGLLAARFGFAILVGG